MAQNRILRIYLDDGLRDSAIHGRHNFLKQIEDVATSAGYKVEHCLNSPAERLMSATRDGYTLFHMDDPGHDRALTFRRVYHYPFWAIEPSARRWEWRVAQTTYPAGEPRHLDAVRFYQHWQKKLFQDAPATARRDGSVYIPLQGRLLEQRSFQTSSPIDMIRKVLEVDRARPVVAALHPKENYSADELAALGALAERNPRLTLCTGNMERLLGGCDYIVTQNSGAAFAGYLFGKPAVLFAGIDFHHIAANVSELGAEGAIRMGPELAPDYASYVHWFWQIMSINAGRPDAPDKIRAAFQRAGWEMS